jgi:hypothetical protein
MRVALLFGPLAPRLAASAVAHLSGSQTVPWLLVLRLLASAELCSTGYFNSVLCLDSHISTYFNKDTRDLFMLCIVLMCQLNRVLFCSIYYWCLFILLLFDFCSSFVHLLFNFCFIKFSLLLIVHEKYSILILDCIPGILIPFLIVCEVPVSTSSSM